MRPCPRGGPAGPVYPWQKSRFGLRGLRTIEGMDWSIALRAAVAQLIAVVAVFALLVAAPLPEGFFARYGVVAGPAAWLVCALVIGRLLSLAWSTVAVAALLGGGTGAAFVAAGLHDAGSIPAVAVFGVACGALEARRRRARTAPTPAR